MNPFDRKMGKAVPFKSAGAMGLEIDLFTESVGMVTRVYIDGFIPWHSPVYNDQICRERIVFESETAFAHGWR